MLEIISWGRLAKDNQRSVTWTLSNDATLINIVHIGVPEFDIPPLDPFLTEYSETTYENGAVRGKVVVKNVNTYGFAKAKFLDIRPRFDEEKNHFQLEVDVELPKVFIDGDYKAEGSIGSYKMGGKGK